MSSRLGAYLVQYRYRVDPLRHGELWPCLAAVRDYAYELGLAQFEVWTDQDDPWTIVETHGYDSWSHCQRLSQKATPQDIAAVYEALDSLVEGGLNAIVRAALTPVDLGESDS